MQVDGELQTSRSVGEQMNNRYYQGFVRGSLRIVREEGLAGLMRGAVPGTLRDATYSGMRIVSAFDSIRENPSTVSFCLLVSVRTIQKPLGWW